MNICAPVIENLNAVEGVDESNWKNISAYYTKDGKTYSIGQESQEPIFRGKRMVLNYTDGSPCPSSSTQRKSTLLSFLCDRDMAASAATVSYVGSMDECSYFFEVRSSAACGGVAAPAEGGLGPAGVFGIIALIAVAVYLLGGCAYQRTVMHQRGWRQLPNYTLWAGIASCFKDNLIIIIYTIAQAFHIDNCFSRVRDRVRRHADDGRGDYSGIFGRRGGGGRAGGGNSQRPDYDEENQFLDQLDEEWEE
ncbi:Cation-independent mannose-6-phosphate receptor CI-MPR [Ascosphaera atra]|nr:Cation-independent mannose-6-phosphate receptor CI-MPR [Ascosphaera atra]